MSTEQKLMIFCDFDGTITENDNIVAIMKRFAPPEWESIKEDVLAQRMSIRNGVGQFFRLLPSSLKKEMTEFILHDARIREGFEDFVEYTKSQDIELIVVSGGMDFFVHPLLQKYDLPIYCNEAKFDEETIRVEWPHGCDSHCENECGCCKPSILRSIGGQRRKIVIGDSITDLQAAKQADFVIARDFLLQKCQELNLPHASFTTFYDVIKILKQPEVMT
ncbi:2-hydroxy-3-keto-5-methylthiopentenyl-1-phosphate phosphatase [Halalkalibacter akibai]|uniref:2-hydroxy-3-keto-5-methylthiopentenyl-1-phosphate phosphatase n=1 Tax=Halalkalibacter akibai (strain ATCC 43226 / DSM 21942 / CIP 109018 / JCM 9157 / 1139) TaxID=1236973 RepID=W4QZM0_HALA3|nr:2-hydroxy-3-keto-5-methylthiopentenyl-1-phosphate phosphatase [Halalkalibacter akibai]GAE36759.1 2-hydroxy-3-keto-5-methylthiopentenyl-1-phosphate phosphatase [Halalkalibacter akibai JCM 9157]